MGAEKARLYGKRGRVNVAHGRFLREKNKKNNKRGDKQKETIAREGGETRARAEKKMTEVKNHVSDLDGSAQKICRIIKNQYDKRRRF